MTQRERSRSPPVRQTIELYAQTELKISARHVQSMLRSARTSLEFLVGNATRVQSQILDAEKSVGLLVRMIEEANDPNTPQGHERLNRLMMHNPLGHEADVQSMSSMAESFQVEPTQRT